MVQFTPMKNEKKMISLLIDPNLLERLDVESAKVDISRNELVIQCIKFALKNMKVPDNDNEISNKSTS